jgi:hypothetical protein
VGLVVGMRVRGMPVGAFKECMVRCHWLVQGGPAGACVGACVC